MRTTLATSLLAITTLCAWVSSCGDDAGGGDGGASASVSSPMASSSTTATGSGAGGGGGMTFLEPACDAPAAAPSKGSCVTVIGTGGAGGGGAGSGMPMGAECNPVTGEPCDVAGGQACDVGGDGDDITGFKCYEAPNTIPLCGDCTIKTDFCKVGTTCDNATHCFAYCCDDGDCGTGVCNKGGFAPVAPDLGICITSS